jgi:regulatory protein
MKIIKQKQIGKYCYLTFDNDVTCKILLEICYQFNLNLGESVTDEKLLKINQKNDDKMCLNSAFDLLSRRIHSEFELSIKLRKKFRYSNINAVINECKRLDLLDDEHFAECYMQELAGKGKGKFQMISSLKTKGITKEVIDKYIGQFTNPDDEMERAKGLAQRKIRSYRNEPENKIREKLTRHLLSKGYSYEIVHEAVASIMKEINA